MEISEVRIKLVEKSAERLRAFCSITLDGDFVIRDLKIIDGTNGEFVAMPSRKLADRCSRCGCKNHLRAKYCNDCGQRLNENRAPKDAQGRSKLHADVAHPINAACRERIQKAVIQAFHEELERAKSPDYRPPKFDDFDDDVDEYALHEPVHREAPVASVQASDNDVNPSDYNSLIAELKREAAGRRERDSDRRFGADSAAVPAVRRRKPETGQVQPVRQRDATAEGGRAAGAENAGRNGTTPPQDDFSSGL